MSNQRKFKNLVINSKFQLRFTKWLFILFLALYVVLLLVGKWVIVDFLELLLSSPNVSPDTTMIAKGLMNDLPLITLALLALFSCFFAVASLLISHKIAGPLHNLSLHLDRMAESKKLEHLKLRENDLFKDIEAKFNNFLDSRK